MARVRIGYGEGTEGQNCPIIGSSMVMWQVQGKVRESFFRIQIKCVHGHIKGKAMAGLETCTLAVLLRQGLMAPGWGESLGSLHVWKYLRAAWKRLRSTLSVSENGPSLSRKLEERPPAFPPSLG